MNNKSGCGTLIAVCVVLLILLMSMGSCGKNSSSSGSYTRRTQTQSNPIRDRDPEFYDYLEDRYNRMIQNK